MSLDPKNAALARKQVDNACVTATVTLRLRDGSTPACAGYLFHSAAGEAMVVHKTPNPVGRPKHWQVTEPVTGLAVVLGCKTRSEAMIDAQSIVNRRPSCLNDAIAIHRASLENAA